ncbi:uncharacterized protein EI90DRAFT_3015822 [Cantharellus anzutake]|uniref:uncharacterized protein n=1 Tax=Cantharellus anzutake TaxID=1750568 RepID=UPI001908D458|nr:uncharacterized protein EI90DRAFT_3015822 [Cantharellus anzutake]KAF8332810.1 hypothetical protein EI90DRAFT_3015822 [Cantharellus anzutake]
MVVKTKFHLEATKIIIKQRKKHFRCPDWSTDDTRMVKESAGVRYWKLSGERLSEKKHNNAVPKTRNEELSVHYRRNTRIERKRIDARTFGMPNVLRLMESARVVSNDAEIIEEQGNEISGGETVTGQGGSQRRGPERYADDEDYCEDS